MLVGDTLCIAGRIGIDPKTGKPPEDLEQEIKILLNGTKLKTFSQRGFPTFETREQALEFLVED